MSRVLSSQTLCFRALFSFSDWMGMGFIGELNGHSVNWAASNSTVLLRFTDIHAFTKPNDVRALKLMDHAAQDLMKEYPDIVLGFGESDEYRSDFSSPASTEPL
jgi:hypothetical protein